MVCLDLKPKYSPYQCPRCLSMEFSYFDNCVHRWCRASNSALVDMIDLTATNYCDRFNHPKGSVKRAKCLDKNKYQERYGE